jgi:predicted DNA-binding transcriptional regulator YafY
MKSSVLLRLLPLLPLTPEQAKTATELRQRFYGLPLHQAPTTAQRRAMERYLSELRGEVGKDAGLNILGSVPGHPARYYLRDQQLVEWFLDRKTALVLRFAADAMRGVLGRSEHLKLGTLEETAEHVIAQDEEARRISQRVRIVPDGYGRLSPDIDPQVLTAAMEAITRNRQLRFDYVSSQGHTSSHERTLLGLVGKDSTLYLVAVEGLGDKPRHFALHRVRSAEVSHLPAQARSDFDLDQYIIDSNQFNHTLQQASADIRLVLRVDPAYMHHFLERKLTASQEIQPPTDADPWYQLLATVPNTYMLPAFLWSMCPGVEVLEPPEIRAQFVEGVRKMASFYLADVPATPRQG